MERVIKAAMIVAVLAYGAIGLVLAGKPDWSKPIIPEGSAATLVLALGAAMMAAWAVGVTLGVRLVRPGQREGAGGAPPCARRLFIASLGLLEAGALMGLAMAVLSKDVRYALGAAVISAVLIARVPASRN